MRNGRRCWNGPKEFALPAPTPPRVECRDMDLALMTAGIAFAASCVWLGVRIFNRRERWAKRTAAGLLIGLPLLYVVSLGPACWITSRINSGNAALSTIYRPIIWIWNRSPDHGSLSNALHWYSCLLAADNWNWFTDGTESWWEEGDTGD